MFRNTFIFLASVAVLGLGFPPGAAFSQSQTGAVKANLDLPFDALGESDDEEEAPEVIVFYSQQYEGDGFFYSCDMSGSMKDEAKFKKLQREVIKNVSQFSEKVQFSFCFFDAGLRKFPTSGRPADANAAMKAAAIAFVMTVTPGAGSCSRPSLIAALQFANQSSSKRKVIIHLSDGQNYCNGMDKDQYDQQTLAEVSAKNTQRVKINTICIGTQDVNEAWMRKLAYQNNGQASRVQ